MKKNDLEGRKFDEYLPLGVTSNGRLIDGYHRTANAMKSSQVGTYYNLFKA